MALGTVDIPTFKYTCDDFKDIISNGFDYTLPNYTIEIVNKISSQVGAPTYIKTPVFEKQTRWKKKRFNDNFNDEEWETFRSFKTTESKNSRIRK